MYVDYYFDCIAGGNSISVFEWSGSRQYKMGILFDLTDGVMYPIKTAGEYTKVYVDSVVQGHSYRLLGMFSTSSL